MTRSTRWVNGVRCLAVALPTLCVLATNPAVAMTDGELMSCVRVQDPQRLWPREVMEVADQFGDGTCQLRRAALLCVRATHGGGEELAEERVEADQDEAMLCYQARCTGAEAAGSIGVRDDLSTETRDVRLRGVRRSRLVCIPVEQVPIQCGNGTVDEGEECDPNAGESSCPGLCNENCTCETMIECDGVPATIVGTLRDDVLFGTEGDDVIHALAGNDTVWGFGGNDIICGGPGRDSLDGGDGDDVLIGGRGNDTLIGDDGNDDLRGQGGEDTLSGGAGDDKLRGGRRADVLVGGAGDDDLDGGEGDDVLEAGAGTDVLAGGSGDDRLFGGNGDDDCDGGPGSDVCTSCSQNAPTCEDVVPQ